MVYFIVHTMHIDIMLALLYIEKLVVPCRPQTIIFRSIYHSHFLSLYVLANQISFNFFTWDTLLMMQLNSLYGDLPFDFIGRKMSNGNFVLNTYHLKFYYLNFEGETQFIL